MSDITITITGKPAIGKTALAGIIAHAIAAVGLRHVHVEDRDGDFGKNHEDRERAVLRRQPVVQIVMEQARVKEPPKAILLTSEEVEPR